MSRLTSKNTKLKLLALVFVFIFSSLTNFALGQEKNSRESVETSKGVLKIEEDAKTIDGAKTAFKSLSLDKKLVFKYVNGEGEFVSIEKYFPQKNPNLIVFFVGAESVSCIGQFFIVDVFGKKPLMTERFGNCSDKPRINYRNQTLTLTFPQGRPNDYYKVGDREIWRYGGGKLEKLK